MRSSTWITGSTIAKVLKENVIKSSPDRPMSRRTVVRSHARLIVAADFVTAEVWTIDRLVRHHALFVIDIARRCVHIVGTTPNPTLEWMAQVARNPTDERDPGHSDRDLIGRGPAPQ